MFAIEVFLFCYLRGVGISVTCCCVLTRGRAGVRCIRASQGPAGHCWVPGLGLLSSTYTRSPSEGGKRGRNQFSLSCCTAASGHTPRKSFCFPCWIGTDEPSSLWRCSQLPRSEAGFGMVPWRGSTTTRTTWGTRTARSASCRARTTSTTLR